MGEATLPDDDPNLRGLPNAYTFMSENVIIKTSSYLERMMVFPIKHRGSQMEKLLCASYQILSSVPP